MGNVIDVREEEKQIDYIVWADECKISEHDGRGFVISDDTGANVKVEWPEVDDLIKALQEAKKQWG